MDALVEAHRQRRAIEDAIVSGAVDEVTFGLADRVSAGAQTLVQGGIEDWGRRYQAELAEERIRDDIDAERYRLARLGGRAVGAAGSFLLPGGAIVRGGKALATAARLASRTEQTTDAMRMAARVADTVRAARARAVPARMAGAARTSGAERAAWLIGPGIANAGIEAASAAFGGEPINPEDAAGAFLGGVIAGRFRGLGPAGSAALSAAATSAYQDRFNDREVSTERAAESAVYGGLLGAAGNRLGEQFSQSLAPRTKGQLGEALGFARSAINGRLRRVGRRVREPILGTRRRWEPDGISGYIRYEDKFGPGAALSQNQRLARSALGEDFVLYHFLPQDVGRLSGMALGFEGSTQPRRPYD